MSSNHVLYTQILFLKPIAGTHVHPVLTTHYPDVMPGDIIYLRLADSNSKGIY